MNSIKDLCQFDDAAQGSTQRRNNATPRPKLRVGIARGSWLKVDLLRLVGQSQMRLAHVLNTHIVHCSLPRSRGAGQETLTKDRAQHERRVLRRQLERPFKFYFDKWHFNCNCAHSMWSRSLPLSPLSAALMQLWLGIIQIETAQFIWGRSNKS